MEHLATAKVLEGLFHHGYKKDNVVNEQCLTIHYEGMDNAILIQETPETTFELPCFYSQYVRVWIDLEGQAQYSCRFLWDPWHPFIMKDASCAKPSCSYPWEHHQPARKRNNACLF